MNESLETAFIYVNGTTGSDTNPGTQALPLQTIGAATTMAMDNNRKSIGSRVIINPGTYREAISFGGSGNTTSLPITFEAAVNGTVIVSGADLWTGWTPYSANPSIYTQSWPYKWGVCPSDPLAPTEQEIILRQEMIVVNGTPLTEVLSLTAMRPGTFFPDEANATVYVWPATGTNMATASVEVATRPALFLDSRQSNVVLRGLTFQYANSCAQNGAVQINNNASNVLIDTDNFLWNNAVGLAVNGVVEHFTVQNSVANHNGELGFHTFQVKYGLWQSDTASYNNWRGAQGAFYTWNTGGTKFMSDHNGTVSNLTTLFNQSHGAAYDTDNRNATLTGLLAVGNVLNGFYAEKSEGPLSFANSYFCGNNIVNNPYMGGFDLRDSMNVSLSGNSFYGNGASEINVVGQPGGYVINDWETGQPYTLLNENLTLTQNIAAAQNATEQAFINGYLGGTEWSQFVSTLSSNQNTWWSPNSNAFTVPTPKAWTTLDFAQWQSLTGQDALSTWASSSLPPACNVSPLGPDYWLLMQTITSSPVVVNPAGVATWNLAAMPLGGMTGTINLTMDGVSAIPGATANLNPATISTSGTSVLTLLTSPTTPAGTYPITIVGSHGNLTRTITVSVTIPKTSVRLSAADVAFPQEPVGGTSTPQQVTLTNTGTTALAISSIAASWQFSETNTCGSTVKAGASCTISIAFAPTQVGLQAGTVTITDSDPTSPQVVSLTGTAVAAPDVSYSVASLDFGWHKLGTSQTRSITVTNSGGATLTITNMTISGTNAADFSQTNNCGSSLAAGATCTINVTFTPSAAGTRSASLSVYDNDVDSSSPQVLGLTGTGG